LTAAAPLIQNIFDHHPLGMNPTEVGETAPVTATEERCKERKDNASQLAPATPAAPWPVSVDKFVSTYLNRCKNGKELSNLLASKSRHWGIHSKLEPMLRE